MRLEAEVEHYRQTMAERYGDEDDPRVVYDTTCWESCIPKTFWHVGSNDVTHNVEAFKRIVVPYRRGWRVALKRGYSLLFLADNGSGKSFFISYLLTQMIKRNLTVYYTTLGQLDADIKRGFGHRDLDVRLTSMLESDFLAIDEVGKGHSKPDAYIVSRFEQLLKQRYDNGEPVLLASNMDYSALCKEYGPTVESMIEGKYTVVTLEPGDFRKTAKAKMKADMGYK